MVNRPKSKKEQKRAAGLAQHRQLLKDKEDKKKGEVEEKEKNYRHIVLEEFAHKISQQEDLKPEFQEFINEHFWELI